ncbi:MAG: hypothetical protein JWO82_3227 [Akkermansiaceae bacterium]|nr:hypothetical protein [Akkermansiaceae bacterium]
MDWAHELRCFFGGAFLTNAIPHFVSGVMGRPFQSPFAKPSGEGLSSSTVNVVWGFFNGVVAWVLLKHGQGFDPRDLQSVAAAGLGMLLLALFAGHHFGRFNGGNSPDSKP